MSPQTLLIGAAFVLLWASAFTVAGVVVKEWTALWALAIRFGLTAPLLVAIAGLARSRLPAQGDLGRIALLGLLGMGGYLACAWLAMARIPTGLVALISATTPLMVAAGEALFLRRSLPGQAWLGLGLGWAGVAMLGAFRAADGIAGAEFSGLAFAVGAAVCQASGLLAYAPAKGRVDMWMASLGQTVVSALLCLMLAFALEGAPPVTASWPTIAAMLWSMLAIGIGAYALYFVMLRRVPASTASALQLLAPPVAAILGWALLDERLHPTDILGGTVTLAGVALLLRARMQG